MENTKPAQTNDPQTEAFRRLIAEVISAKDLQKTLIRLYVDYTLLVFDSAKTHELPPTIADQMYYLSLLIEVCGTEGELERRGENG